MYYIYKNIYYIYTQYKNIYTIYIYNIYIYTIYTYVLKNINQFGLNPRGEGNGNCDMAFGKRLHISGEMQSGNLLTKLLETKVITMWIYEENIIWIL